MPKKDVDQRFILDSTQPLIQSNGMLRWALSNVAHAATPPCEPVLDSVHANVNWSAADAVKPGAVNALNTAAYWGEVGGNAESLLAAKNSKLEVRVGLLPSPLHVVLLCSMRSGPAHFTAWPPYTASTGVRCSCICAYKLKVSAVCVPEHWDTWTDESQLGLAHAVWHDAHAVLWPADC